MELIYILTIGPATIAIVCLSIGYLIHTGSQPKRKNSTWFTQMFSTCLYFTGYRFAFWAIMLVQAFLAQKGAPIKADMLNATFFMPVLFTVATSFGVEYLHYKKVSSISGVLAGLFAGLAAIIILH